MPNHNGSPNILFLKHCINGFGKIFKRIIRFRLIAFAISRQIDEYQLQVAAVAKRLILLLPRLYIAAKTMNIHHGNITFSTGFIMHFHGIVNLGITRL